MNVWLFFLICVHVDLHGATGKKEKDVYAQFALVEPVFRCLRIVAKFRQSSLKSFGGSVSFRVQILLPIITMKLNAFLLLFKLLTGFQSELLQYGESFICRIISY